MTDQMRALYRLEFRTDMTDAAAPVIHFGYMLEAAVAGGFRFLGLASRESLTRIEADRIDLATWHELADLDTYMEDLFERAWGQVSEAGPDDLRLACEHLAKGFSARSALRFVPLPTPAIAAPAGADADTLHLELYQQLIHYRGELKPALVAPVIPLPKRDAPKPVMVLSKYREDVGPIAA